MSGNKPYMSEVITWSLSKRSPGGSRDLAMLLPRSWDLRFQTMSHIHRQSPVHRLPWWSSTRRTWNLLLTLCRLRWTGPTVCRRRVILSIFVACLWALLAEESRLVCIGSRAVHGLACAVKIGSVEDWRDIEWMSREKKSYNHGGAEMYIQVCSWWCEKDRDNLRWKLRAESAGLMLIAVASRVVSIKKKSWGSWQRRKVLPMGLGLVIATFVVVASLIERQ